MQASPINVLFLMTHMAIGGSERLVLSLVRNLDRRRFSPSVGWFYGEAPLPEFTQLNVPLHFFPKTKAFDWRAIAQIARVIREHRIHVVNAHHFMSFFYAFYGAKLANRAGLIYTEHSEADVHAVTGKWHVAGRQLLRRSDAAIGISERVTEALVSHFRFDRATAHTIRNGVDFDLFAGGATDRAAVRQSLGLAPDDVAFGCVANFYRNKNHVGILRAFRAVLARRPNAKLLLVGQGFEGNAENSEPEVRRFVGDHGMNHAVRLLGYRSDVPAILQSLDVFCLFSFKEGLPLGLIEAMASGLPVVGSDIDGIRPVIESGVNGFLAPPDDDATLAAHFTRLTDDADLRTRLGQASKRIAGERYTLDRCIDETQRLLLSAVTSSPDPAVRDSQSSPV